MKKASPSVRYQIPLAFAEPNHKQVFVKKAALIVKLKVGVLEELVKDARRGRTVAPALGERHEPIAINGEHLEEAKTQVPL